MPGLILFTFHYGSIQISVNDYINDIKNKFTFHYGSIQMALLLYEAIRYVNLHSTMVLFKLRCIINKLRKYIFTFHYGSIQMYSQ